MKKHCFYTSAKGNISLSLYEMSGKLIKTLNTKADGSAIDLNIVKNGLYVVKITNGSENEVVKFAK
ncbi:MAG TPA: T9SS type A sorting domain-containing protein [Kaistella sp.]|nr:T9SS type A sorting domain-containing protein [Kaistella sp.]